MCVRARVCVCVCVCVRERERERENLLSAQGSANAFSLCEVIQTTAAPSEGARSLLGPTSLTSSLVSLVPYLPLWGSKCRGREVVVVCIHVISTQARTDLQTHTHTHTHTCAGARTHTAGTHAVTHTHTHTCACVRTHTAGAHTDTHTHTHTHTHTLVLLCPRLTYALEREQNKHLWLIEEHVFIKHSRLS